MPGEDPGTSEVDTGAAAGDQWYKIIEQISDRTKLNWSQIYELPVIEFLNYVGYVKRETLRNNEKTRKQIADIKKRNKR